MTNLYVYGSSFMIAGIAWAWRQEERTQEAVPADMAWHR